MHDVSQAPGRCYEKVVIHGYEAVTQARNAMDVAASAAAAAPAAVTAVTALFNKQPAQIPQRQQHLTSEPSSCR
jgi:hypothetical protein